MPIETQAEQPEAFITTCASEDISEDVLDTRRRMLGCQTKDAEAVEKWEDIGWNDFIDEHEKKGSPEESHSFVVRCSVEVERWRPDVGHRETPMSELTDLEK